MSCTLEDFNAGAGEHIPMSFQFQATAALARWRDESAPGTAGAWGRRFTIALPMALLGVVGLIDAAVSLVLCLITAPVELCGVKLSRFFLHRAVDGTITSLFNLSYHQYANMAFAVLAPQDESSEEVG